MLTLDSVDWSALERLATVGGVLLTALFTGAMALLSYRADRGAVVMEGSVELIMPSGGPGGQIVYRLTLRNQTKSSISVRSVTVTGAPVLDVWASGRKDKSKAWPSNRAPVYMNDIDPASSGSTNVVIVPDWSSWARSLWFRRVSRPAVSISIFDNAASAAKASRLTQKIAISAKTIKAAAAEIAASTK